MKISSAVVALAFTLSACVSNAPKLSPEEAKEKRVSTLNVYPDNRVTMKVVVRSPSRNSAPSVFWSWTERSEYILAVQVGGLLYNAKDIARITSTPDKNGLRNEVVLYFRNGEQKTTAVSQSATNQSGLSWVGCKADKSCDTEYFMGQSVWQNSFGSILAAIYDQDLNKSAPSRDPNYEIMRDYRSVPTADRFQEVIFLDAAGQDSLNQRFASLKERWQEQVRKTTAANEAAARAAEAREQAIREEAVMMRKSIRIGTRTNCGDVFEVRQPMAGVQTSVGAQFLRVDELYGPSASCRFVNGKYIGR